MIGGERARVCLGLKPHCNNIGAATAALAQPQATLPMIRNTLGLLVCLTVLPLRAGSLLVEAEAFGDPGGWKVDTQFMLQMGSPYLLAHGLGTPVADATTTVELPETGTYRIFVRTKDWVAPWAAEGAPGKFQLLVNGTPLREIFGTKGAEWHWHDGGVLPVIDTKVTPVPYRCFYSRNIPNLFMVGRCVSVTHEALGTVRVMRTCGMMGEVVGKAAWLASTRKTTPRGVYENYLPQLIDLLQQPGALRRDSPDGTLYLPANAAQPSAIDRGLPSDSLAGIVVDDQAARLKGKWSHGDGLKPTVNNSYAYAGAGDGVSATFPIRVKKSGRYEVRYYLRPDENRCKIATLTIAHGKGSSEVPVDLSREHSAKNYQVVGSYDFVDVLPASITITGPTSSGFLHADCVQLVPVK